MDVVFDDSSASMPGHAKDDEEKQTDGPPSGVDDDNESMDSFKHKKTFLASKTFIWSAKFCQKIRQLKCNRQEELIEYLDEYLEIVQYESEICNRRPVSALYLGRHITNVLYCIRDINKAFSYVSIEESLKIIFP